MKIWFNITEIRQQLFKERVVFILSQRLREDGLQKIFFNGLKSKATVFFRFLREIKDDSELENFLRGSGFQSVQEWRKKVEGNYLYLVELLYLEDSNLESKETRTVEEQTNNS